MCFFCWHPQAPPETGTLSQGRQPLAAPQLAAKQAQTHSLTLHLPCLPLRCLSCPGMRPWVRDTALGGKPQLSLGRGHPRGHAQPSSCGKETSKKRPGPVPTRPGVPSSHPAAPHSAQESALPTHSRGLIKSMFRARAVTGTWPPAWHGSAFIRVISGLVTKAGAQPSCWLWLSSAPCSSPPPVQQHQSPRPWGTLGAHQQEQGEPSSTPCASMDLGVNSTAW